MMKYISLITIGLIPVVFGFPTFSQKDNFSDQNGKNLKERTVELQPISEECREECVCHNQVNFVCGSDSITYRNPCYLKCRICNHPGITLAFSGSCHDLESPNIKKITGEDIEAHVDLGPLFEDARKLVVIDSLIGPRSISVHKESKSEKHNISKREINSDSQNTIKILRDLIDKEYNSQIQTENDDLELSTDLENRIGNMEYKNDENQIQIHHGISGNILNAMYNLRKANKQLLKAKNARKIVIHELDKLAFTLKDINDNNHENNLNENSMNLHENDDSKNRIYDETFNIFDLFNINKDLKNENDQVTTEITVPSRHAKALVPDESDKILSNENFTDDDITESATKITTEKNSTKTTIDYNSESNTEKNASDNNENIENEQRRTINQFDSFTNEENENIFTENIDTSNTDLDNTQNNFSGTDSENDNNENTDQTSGVNQDTLNTENVENTANTDSSSGFTVLSYEIFDHTDVDGFKKNISQGIENPDSNTKNMLDKQYDSSSTDFPEVTTQNNMKTIHHIDEDYDSMWKDSPAKETDENNQDTIDQSTTLGFNENLETTYESSNTNLDNHKEQITSDTNLSSIDIMETTPRINDMGINEHLLIGEGVENFPLNSINIPNPVPEEKNDDVKNPFETIENIDEIFVGDYLKFMDELKN